MLTNVHTLRAQLVKSFLILQTNAFDPSVTSFVFSDTAMVNFTFFSYPKADVLKNSIKKKEKLRIGLCFCMFTWVATK